MFTQAEFFGAMFDRYQATPWQDLYRGLVWSAWFWSQER